jgi:hypothetical protein
MFLCNRFKWFIVYINNKMLRRANKNNSNNNTNNNTNNTSNNDQAKIYFPSIPVHVLQNALHGAPNSNKKQNQNQDITQNKTQLDKYISSENQKTTIYSTTSILEILNNELYAVYPSDKIILTSSISIPVVGSGAGLKQQHQQHPHLQLLVDYSVMKRSQTPSYQIPYDFKLHSCLVKKYKMNLKSNTTFVIEYKDNKVYDFYVLAKLSGLPGLPGLSGNRIEIDNFIKEDIISFLLMLNLY